MQVMDLESKEAGHLERKDGWKLNPGKIFHLQTMHSMRELSENPHRYKYYLQA